MITKEKFMAYEDVRMSGMTNMFDLNNVINLAKMRSRIALSKSEIRKIIKEYEQLRIKFLKK